MIAIHAIWTDGRLHLWGERPKAAAHPRAFEISTSVPFDTECKPATKSGPLPDYMWASDPGALRSRLGDAYDSLLVSGAADSELAIRLPFRDGQPLASPARSTAEPDLGGATERIKSVAVDVSQATALVTCRIPTLSFPPADAIDLLTASPVFPREDVQTGASLRYWSRLASYVLELLAAQQFVPAAHGLGENRYRGYWRLILDEQQTSERLAAFITSMPPLCRSIIADGGGVQASAIIENFLWTTVDAFVRRCLDGDELAHAIQERRNSNRSLQMLWLQALVRPSGELEGEPDDRRRAFDTVAKWVARLEPLGGNRTCRTCFRLHAPPPTHDNAPRRSPRPWKLTVHAQAIHDSKLVVDASQLCGGRGAQPPILKRPFDLAWEQVQADLVDAARHFPPLRSCIEASGTSECQLTLEEAYAFLRDAAPILETEGFGVWLPQWWHQERPRLRMWLDVRPEESSHDSTGSAMGLEALVRHDWRVAVGDEDLTPQELTRLAESMESLVQVRGHWVELQSAELRTAAGFLSEHRGGKITVFEALRHCYIADDLETGLPVGGLRASGWIKSFLDAGQAHQSLQRLNVPSGFVGTLRPYQLRGMEWLAFLSRLGLGACLADDMGLGKTIQLIAVWLHERESNPSTGPTLLVVPMSLVGNWQREIEKFGPSLRVMVHHGLERLTGNEFVGRVRECDVVISTYGLIHRDMEHLAAVDWHRVALDEAQNIKNPAAKQSQAIRSLRATHRTALTGTPVENRLSELWSIMDFLNVAYLGNASEFRRRFAVPIERHHDTDKAQRLRHLIRPFVLRRLKNDPKIEVDLPPKMEMKVFCNLTREQAGLYEAVVNEMLQQIDNTGGIQRRGMILATLVKLKQICNHPAHFLGDGSSLPHRSGKCDRLADMIDEVLAEGDRALIFTQFRVMGDLIFTLLRDLFDREVLFLHGGTARKKRDAIVARFQDENENAPLLILSLKAGGYGLNLTAASHVFHFDRWWNPAVEDQATDRAHRIGQDKRVQVHKFVCIGTLEERIDALLEEKRKLAENIVGTGEDWLTGMSTEKLRTMFALSRDAVAED